MALLNTKPSNVNTVNQVPKVGPLLSRLIPPLALAEEILGTLRSTLLWPNISKNAVGEKSSLDSRAAGCEERGMF